MAAQKSSPKQVEFSGWRSFFWPVHSEELKKFLPMGIIMLFILFNYTILRDTKDALVIAAASGSGPEVLSFIKGWIVMPAAILFVSLYVKLSNIFSREQLFYGIVITFLAFFGIFAFYLYPNKEFFHPPAETIEYLQQEYTNLRWVFPIYGNWTFALFYACSELWGSVMISLLFWQFANEITPSAQAKRFYPLLSLIANLALIFSGTAVEQFSNIRQSLPPGVDAWGLSLQYLATSVIISGILAMLVYRWMNVKVLTDSRHYVAAGITKKKTKKPSLGFIESIVFLAKSPYIGLIALLVLSYGLSINLVEVVWKKQLHMHCPDPNDYNTFMGQFSRATGICTILIIIFTKELIRRCRWVVGAIITPIALASTAAIFFSFVFLRDVFDPYLLGIGFSSLSVAVYIGALQNIFSKGTKYALFDPTKEMSYIPLDQESKIKGKAAVDVIGGRLGKAMGGYVQQILFIATAGSALTLAPIFAVIVAIVILVWLFSVKALGRRYYDLVEKHVENKLAK
jgi:AAA family ATP:ADP antiporter